MKVWIDQDLCTGDRLCAEIAPDVFTMKNHGVVETVFCHWHKNQENAVACVHIVCATCRAERRSE